MDDGYWRDSKFGDGKSGCKDIEAHVDRAKFCHDNADYSAEARRACPCACPKPEYKPERPSEALVGANGAQCSITYTRCCRQKACRKECPGGFHWTGEWATCDGGAPPPSPYLTAPLRSKQLLVTPGDFTKNSSLTSSLRQCHCCPRLQVRVQQQDCGGRHPTARHRGTEATAGAQETIRVRLWLSGEAESA